MATYDNPRFEDARPIAPAGMLAGERAAFITRTYTHLLGAILAFVGIEVMLFRSGIAATLAERMLGVNWLLILGAFLIVGWFASRTAHRAQSAAAQYAALAAFVVAEAIIFVPLLYVAEYSVGGGVIQKAAAVTLTGFMGLTLVAFVTRKDFSFLRGLLGWGFVLALIAIVGGVVFGFDLGLWFSVAMIGLAGAAVLYDTSNILHHYPTNRHVAASLELFSSIALMFWYVLRLFMSRR
jgi:uncharacterized protein